MFDYHCFEAISVTRFNGMVRSQEKQP